MIKKISSANPGVKRPLRVSDVQDLWTALTMLHGNEVSAGVFIVYGFTDKGDGFLSKGVVSKDGVLYYHPDIAGYRIPVGGTVYGHELAGVDQRVFDDATTQDFAFNMVATTVASAVTLGVFTVNFVAQRKAPKVQRVVYGRLQVQTDAGYPQATFTPDNAEDSDITVTDLLEQTANTVGISLKDGNGNRMKRNFEAVLENSTDTFGYLGTSTIPAALLVGRSGSLSDITVYYSAGVPVEDTYVDYRVKILFDV